MRDTCTECHQIIPRDRNRYEVDGQLLCSWRCIVLMRERLLGAVKR